MCTTTEINTAPNKHPKFLPHNNIQKHPKNSPQTTPQQPSETRDTPPSPNPNTQLDDTHSRAKPRDMSSPQVTRQKHHNSPTQTCDLAQHPTGISEHSKSQTRNHPPGAETPEHNKQNPNNHRPTRTETSARIAFTNLLTAYIATTELLSQLLHNLTNHTHTPTHEKAPHHTVRGPNAAPNSKDRSTPKRTTTTRYASASSKRGVIASGFSAFHSPARSTDFRTARHNVNS